jgi:hypothetical protein
MDTTSYNDTISLSVATLEYLYPYGYNAYCRDLFNGSGWGYRYTIPTANPWHLEFYVDHNATRFFYDGSAEKLIFEDIYPYWLILRDCPGRPVFDREDNIHMIWEGGTDTLFYGYSIDTLNTIEVIDTLTNMPPFLLII